MKAHANWLLAAAVVILLPVGARAADKIIKKIDPNAPRTDQEFLAKAIADAIAEVKFGENAVKNASDRCAQICPADDRRP